MRRRLAAVDRGVEYLAAAIFAAMVVIGGLQVFHRFVLNSSLGWSEEAQVFGHIWIVFLGIPIAYRRGAHLFIETYRDKYPPLLRPVIIVGGILSGVFTATEAGVVACVYALVVGVFVYRKIRWPDLPGILVESAIMTTMVSCVIAVAGASGWPLAYLQFNQSAVVFVTSMSQTRPSCC
jgi:TRAP-type C4-dicarboxylate transport system permease large subunit